jgi:hypothetical protein
MWHVPVDAIERSGVAVCLSDAMRRVETLATALETMLADSFARQIPDQRHHGADMVVNLVVQVGPALVVPEDVPEPELPSEENSVSADEEGSPT